MRKNSSSPGPIYLFALVWVLCAAALPLFRLVGILLTLGLSVFSAVALARYIRKRAAKKADFQGHDTATQEAPAQTAPPAEAAPKKPEKSPYSPEVTELIADGRVAMRELGRLYASIKSPEIRGKINEIMAVSDKIVRDAIDDPSDVPQIRKFLDFYLPTTIKLLNAYDRMSSQGITGENISGSMQSIEEMLDTTIVAYKKQLDSLFANQATDIQTDIEAMNGMLAREGLGGKSYLDMKEFMKQYEAQQKGSTSNG